MPDDQSIAQSSPPPRKTTLLMRVVASLWFGVTAFLAMLLNLFASFWRDDLGSKVLFGIVIAPTIIFALCGATIGAAILRIERGNAIVAMGAGATLSAIAVGIFILGWSAVEVATGINPGLSHFVFTVFYLTAIWGTSRGLPLLLLGMFSGWLLYRFKLRWIH